jgi:branched-chain amino acid transport system substrate-binding protein
VIAEYAHGQGWKKVYTILDDSISYTRGECGFFKQRFEQLGGKIVGNDTMKNTDPSFASQVTRLRQAEKNADFVLICSYPPGGATIVKQIRAAGIKMRIFGGAAFDGNYWLKAVPNLTDFWFAGLGSVFGDDSNPAMNVFLKKYKARTKSTPPSSLYPIAGYSGIEMYAKAIERAGSVDTAAVKAELDKFRNEPLLAGPTTYTPRCHIPIGRVMTIMTVKNGKDEFVRKLTPKVVPKSIC